MKPQKISFIIIYVAVLALFYSQLKDLFALSLHNELYSHIILIPLVSGYFMFMQKDEIFKGTGYAPVAGIPFIAVGIALYLTGARLGGALNNIDYLSLMTFSALTIWVGGFIIFFGTRAFRAALFPLMFMLFAVPVPGVLMESFIHFLRVGSTGAANAILKLTGVPFAREGFCFYLPGLGVEVAEECSGIRSGISLVITSIVAGKLFLNTNSRRTVLVLLALPIAIVKNGMRIVTLSLLGAYVDKRVLSSSLHKYGGIPFFLVGLLLLGTILWALRRTEGDRGDKGIALLATGVQAKENE